MIKTNFHTHSVFCDGKDSLEEMVLEAIQKNFSHLGFSSHSYFEPDKEYALSLDRVEEYKSEIAMLKAKYREKIKLYCGIEQDCFSNASTDGFEYVIGSVHYVLKNNEYISVDLYPEELKVAIERHYGGDFDAFAEDYFCLVADVLNKTNADIIGHIDLVSKFSEIMGITETERYLAAAEKAVKALIPYGKPFEINTGAMARGYRTAPYPSENILKMIYNYGGSIIFSSDCHDKNYLDFGFAEALNLAKKVGFTEQVIFEDGKFKVISL